MPYRPLGPCSAPGCVRRAVRRGRCEAHAQEAEARYRAAHPDTRPSAGERGYGAEWRALRAAYLKRNPHCQEPGCLEAATDVDHRVARAQGGTDDWANLQGLCHRHHTIKTNRVDGGFGNARAKSETRAKEKL